MSEKGPTSTPDTEPEDIYHIEGIPDALQVAKIKELRDAQQDREVAYMGAVDFRDPTARADAKAQAYAEIDDMIKDHLLANGVLADDDKFGEYEALLRGYSIDKVGKEWDTGGVDDKGVYQAPKFQEAYQDIKDKYEVPATDTVDTKTTDPTDTGEPKPDDKKEGEPKPEPEPEKKKEEEKEKSDEEKKAEAAKERAERIKELESKIGELQKGKAAAFAKRMSASPFKLIIPGQRKKLDAAFEKAEEEYLTALEEYQKLLIEAELEASKGESYVPANEQIGRALEDRFSDILESDHKLQRDAMLEEGGFRAKILEKYQNASPRQKLALAIGLGAVFVAGGAVVAIGLGGAAAVVAGGGLAGLKGVKTYSTVQSRMYNQKNPDKLKFQLRDPEGTSPQEALQLALDKLRSESRADIKSADRRKVLAVGLGALAAGGGGALMHGLDLAGNHFFGGNIRDILTPDVHAGAPPVDAEHAWSVPQVEVKPPVMEFAPGAADLPNGGGGLAETKDVLGNVPQAQVQEVWNQVIPQLQTMDNGFGRPLVYQMDNGGYGLRMTADHQMPRAAMEAIANKYQELYGQMPPGVHMTESVTTITEAHPIPVDINQPVVTPAEVSQMSGVIKMDTIPYSEIVKPENAPLFEKLSYVQQGLDGDNYARALGLPPKVWLENLEPFITERVNSGTTGFIDTFYVANDGTGVHFTGRPIAPSVLRDMLNEIPVGVRNSLKVG